MISKPELEWMAILPELITAIASMVVLLLGMGSKQWNRVACIALSAAAFLGVIVVAMVEFNATRYGAFGGLVDSDQLAQTGRLIAAVSGLVAVVLAVRGRSRDGRHGEFHALLLAAVCGMGLFASAGSFVSLFIGLELFSIALYVLCALDAERSAALEAGLKYLIVGGMSSAVLLYGAALVYGATGSFDLAVIGASDERGLLLYAGAALVLGGLAFKVSAAPMHWWTPDVYAGAGTPVTAFMSTATKAVAFLVLARVVITTFEPEASTWVPVVAALAVASIVVGNGGALAQGHLKRMLAYSSIAQAGYLLCGIVGWDSTGVPALVYALIVYTAMTLGAFAYVMVLERELGRDATFADLAGRGWVREDQGAQHALPGLGLTICALSLAGIPPTAGFFSKFGLFDAVVESGYAWLAVVAAVGSVVSLAYYLRVVVELYMRSPDAARADLAAADLPDQSEGEHQWAVGTRMPVAAGLAVALAAVTLLLAFVPERVFDAGCDVKRDLVANSGDCTSVDAAAASPAPAPAE
ncbi:MAG: proton-translocating NADH-quinone oxidoreductase, chain [Thermoleophilia bacterium]|nr:proton-translocating NADH-quinone oxidoreductase, chain [Thermoleophilia bacterium]